jgi:hypothetical protein
MTTPEQKGTKAKKPTGNIEGKKVAQGLEKEPASKAEVAGHASSGGWYLCHCCGAANYVPYGWEYFYCWNDYCLNFI